MGEYLKLQLIEGAVNEGWSYICDIYSACVPAKHTSDTFDLIRFTLTVKLYCWFNKIQDKLR